MPNPPWLPQPLKWGNQDLTTGVTHKYVLSRHREASISESHLRECYDGLIRSRILQETGGFSSWTAHGPERIPSKDNGMLPRMAQPSKEAFDTSSPADTRPRCSLCSRQRRLQTKQVPAACHEVCVQELPGVFTNYYRNVRLIVCLLTLIRRQGFYFVSFGVLNFHFSTNLSIGL